MSKLKNRSKGKEPQGRVRPPCPAFCLESLCINPGKVDRELLITAICEDSAAGLYSEEDTICLLLQLNELTRRQTGAGIPPRVWKRHIKNIGLPPAIKQAIREYFINSPDSSSLVKILLNAIPRYYQDEIAGDMIERYQAKVRSKKNRWLVWVQIVLALAGFIWRHYAPKIWDFWTQISKP